jgi:predicted outer membrane protein
MISVSCTATDLVVAAEAWATIGMDLASLSAMRSTSSLRTVAPLLVSVAVARCGGTPPPDARAPVLTSASAPIDDGQIAEIVDVIDVQQGYLLQEALKRGANPDVRRLASELVADHAADQEAMLAGLRRGRAGLQPSAVVELFEAQSRETRAWLSNVSGATFDRDFVRAEVKQQSRAFDLLDHVLIPGVHDGGLRALLVHRRQIAADRVAETTQLALRLGAPA